MRVLLVVNLLLLLISIGYAFRITEFLEQFVDSGHRNSERQSTDVSDQIVPVFAIAFFASLVNSLLFMNSATTTAEEEYHWCYLDPSCDASTWGDHFELCNGMKQSPIDIVTTGVTQLSETTPLSFTKYDEVRVMVLENTVEHNDDRSKLDRDVTDNELKNNGHTAQLDVNVLGDGVGRLTGGPLSGEYQVLQLHFHWGKDDTRGSEHTYDGREYPIELHVVHVRSDLADDVATALATTHGLAVTGFMFEVDTMDNAALKPLTDALKNIVNSKDKIPFVNSGFRLDTLLDGVAPISGATTPYSTYSGSLTTPTCNEAVHWINFLTPLKISSAQLAEFRTLMDGKGKNVYDNYRPPQPLNGRTVTHYMA